jgi:hypothetical protein
MNRTLWCQAFDVGLTWAGGPSPPGHHMSRDSDTCHLRCVSPLCMRRWVQLSLEGKEYEHTHASYS